MKVSLEIKKRCSFFWLRAIRNARIDKCCAECFIGDKLNEVSSPGLYSTQSDVPSVRRQNIPPVPAPVWRPGYKELHVSQIGYDYSDGKLTINPYEAEQVRKIFEWYLSGLSLKAVTKGQS